MRTLALAGLGAALLLGGLDAQAQSQKRGDASGSKHYRWEDENGRVHFSDTLPVEALRLGRTVYHGDRVVGKVERPLTDEERSLAQREAQAQAELARLEEQRQQEVELLRRSYPDEASVRADFAQRKVFFQDRITASETSIGQYRRLLVDRLTRAAELELGKKKVPAKLANEIKEAVGIVREHQRVISMAQENISSLASEEATVLKTLSGNAWTGEGQGPDREF